MAGPWKLLVPLAATVVLVAGSAPPQAATKAAPPRITGPYAHQNLTVFLIHGAGRTRLEPLTLQEAIEQKKIVVHETGSVNTLSVENSSDVDIFIHSGDIVKGGRQDRMISQDLIVPPKSGKVSLGSFCVESGRWSQRQQESAGAFGSSRDQVVGNAIKIAARKNADQGEVWRQVAATQEELKVSLGGAPVASPASQSSLQLTLENERVKGGIEAYVKALTSLAASKRDIQGCVFAINGRITSAEVYASPSLLRKMWPKLLKSAATEALAKRSGANAARVTAADVQAFLAGAEQAPAEGKDLSERVKVVTREADKVLLFETLDRARNDEWVHKSYLAK